VTDWNFADMWETVTDLLPDAPMLVHGGRRWTFRQVNRRANAIARALLDRQPARQAKVAHYLYNGPEYLESMFAIFKAGLVPVNTNYRYEDDELVYLWANSDAVAVVFHGCFAERIERLRHRLPDVATWLWVDDGSGACPDWAVAYEDAATGGGDEPVRGSWGRSGDDLFLLYTGGTTGTPKGVMWRQDDLFARINSGNLVKVPEEGGLDGLRHTLVGPGPVHVPACPLMHGTGAFTSLGMLSIGGSVVTLTSRRFDPVELLDTIDADNVNTVAIVGDAFAKPILAALDSQPNRWRLSTLVGMISSGVMWSEETKRGLLRHHGSMVLIDAFSSSEAVGMGTSTSSGSSAEHTGQFILGPDVRVVDPKSGADVVPGSGSSGVLALGGRNPLGYYKDEAKTAATFRVFDGRRFSVPGDWAEVDSSGVVHVLGRGSMVVNTGGEKVFPEEVEEALKRHPAVRDAVVVGLPDDRFGEVVTAAVELHPGASATEAELIDYVRNSLARYKAPRRVRFVDSIGRAATGKVDYLQHRSAMVRWATKSQPCSS